MHPDASLADFVLTIVGEQEGEGRTPGSHFNCLEGGFRQCDVC